METLEIIMGTLVRALFAGSLDIIGDVHGEIDALLSLLQRLGYDEDGGHPENRRLVFVGDLVDRGPDSLAVVSVVQRLIERERAQCVLGNHELNLLLGSRKPDNVWFFHHSLPPSDPAFTRPQTWIDERERKAMLDFFAGLPLALERSDLRVVHACWSDSAIGSLRGEKDAVAWHEAHRERIDAEVRRRGLSPAVAKLVHQNENPVKQLTSGPEAKTDRPFVSMGKLRHERRVAWWREYSGPLCVFGHYWRILLPHEVDGDLLFASDRSPAFEISYADEAACIDFSVGKRYLERSAPGFAGAFRTRLAALRLPERTWIFDTETDDVEVRDYPQSPPSPLYSGERGFSDRF